MMEQAGGLRMERSVAAGLSNAEARRRLAVYGPNAVADKTPPPWRIFHGKFWSPIAWMLGVAAIVEIGLGAYVEAGLIAALLLFNATRGFHPGKPGDGGARGHLHRSDAFSC